MSFPFSEYPYVNYSEFNYDWIIKKIRLLLDGYDQLDTDFASLHDYVMNYFENLDVDAEISAKIDSMVADGTFGELVDDLISEAFSALHTEIEELETETDNKINTTRTNLQSSINSLTSSVNTSQHAQDQRLDTLDSRVDNLVASPPVASNEVQDVRTNYEGIEYTVAGEAVRGSDSAISEAVKLVGRSVGFEDLALNVGWTQGVLNQSGGVDSSSNFVTSGYIPVEAGKGYTFESVGGMTGYTLYYSEYNSANAFLSPRVSATAANPRYYTASANAAYVRVSVSYAVYKAGYYIHKTNGSVIDYQLEKEIIESLESHFEYKNLIDWDKISNAELITGGGTNNTQNFITTDYIPVEQGIQYMLYSPNSSAAYTLYRSTYDANKTFITRVSFSASVPIREYTAPAGVAYVRFTFSHSIVKNGMYFGITKPIKEEIISRNTGNVCTSRNTNIINATPLDLHNEISYREIIVKPSDYEIPSGHTGQGFAIYGKYVFQMCDSDHILIYDAEDQFKVVGSYSATIGHGNTANFGRAKYESGDAFPLLYVSSIDGNVYVLRVTLTSATLIRTVYFDPAIFGYAPQVAISQNVGEVDCIVVGKTEDSDFYTTLKVHHTSLMYSNLDTISGNLFRVHDYELYGTGNPMNDSGNSLVLQGVAYINGQLWLASGGSNAAVLSQINVWHVAFGIITQVAWFTNFSEDMSVNELEGVGFQASPYGGLDVLCYIRTIGYHKLIF